MNFSVLLRKQRSDLDTSLEVFVQLLPLNQFLDISALQQGYLVITCITARPLDCSHPLPLHLFHSPVNLTLFQVKLALKSVSQYLSMVMGLST